LRTLSPLLRTLGRNARGWLDARHRFPIPLMDRARLEGLSDDLHRRAESLDTDRPLLTIMLMGGTGVGKSTLLNALAGSAVAQASFTRPTTRDPVVYYHHSVKPDRFDPALRHCRLVQHDRESLAQKVIVDTPDLDSNDLTNRDKLTALLPLADIVLYVGSQEKYHDQIGWELFLEQRRRRAFAFVLNKWDRCLHPGASGLRPDEDLIRDLKAEGFENPLLFRTMAQTWLDHELAGKEGRPDDLPEGEQFAELRQWLEMGLSRLEIEAVKARGVEQLLAQLEQGVEKVRPPDLTDAAERTRVEWERILEAESDVSADVLLGMLEPYQSEVEHHFSVEGQRRFRGFIAWWLRLFTKAKYAGSALRDRIPMVPRGEKVETPRVWNLAEFTRECSRVAGERVLDRRGPALVSKLVVEADRQKYPVSLLQQPAGDAAKLNWHERYDRALMESLAEVERNCTKPTGWRYYVQSGVIFAANALPETVFVVGYLFVLWRYFDPGDTGVTIDTTQLLMPILLTVVTLVLVQVLIAVLLPLKWSAIRGQFHDELGSRLRDELKAVYAAIPADVALVVLEERRTADELLAEVQEVRIWLEERQHAAHIGELYGA